MFVLFGGLKFVPFSLNVVHLLLAVCVHSDNSACRDTMQKEADLYIRLLSTTNVNSLAVFLVRFVHFTLVKETVSRLVPALEA